MQRRVLGSSGFEISTIGLGSWAIGGHMWGGQDDTQSAEAIHAAVDHGINWIDTAPIYGSGHSEEVVGRAVKQLPSAKRPLIFTKFGLGADSDVRKQSASAAEVQAECDGSLRRLGVERIDLYQLHWPAPQPIAETAAACAALLKAGKIRAIGVSNFSVAQLEEWRATGVPLHSVQPPFSILRPAVKESVLPWCAAHGRRRDLVLATLQGIAVRQLVPGQVVPGGRRAQYAQGLRGRTFPAASGRGRRDSRGRHGRRSECAAAVRRRAAAHLRAHRRHRRRAQRAAGRGDRGSRGQRHRSAGERGVGDCWEADEGSRRAM